MLFQNRQEGVWFHNPTDAEVRTVIANAKIVVPPGGNLELPRHLAWVVKSRGLRLKEGRNPAEGAPDAHLSTYKPPKPVLPRGVELGEIRETARAENEDPEIGDGPDLAGDDDSGDDGDPIARAAAQLEKQGVDTASLPGAKASRKNHQRGVQ